MNGQRRYGARVYFQNGDTLLIKQTVKSGEGHTDEYIVDQDREEHVALDDDRAIPQAIRRAVRGQMGHR